jgi:2-polyprenyl-6-methoxyphenol hydroxylase-like FAD-dependent oxidoreductase
MLIEGLAGLGSTPAPVCIVGSGPVGLALAVDLTKRGVRCILLESGGLEPTPEIQSLSDAERIEPRSHDDMRIAVARRLGGTSHLWGGR